MAIRGDLHELSLATLVQMLCIERRSAALRLTRRGEEGVVYLADGEVVHARLGPLEGEDAAYRLLTWSDGGFAIDEDAGPWPRTIGKSLNHLLIESTRLLDERRRDEAACSPSGPLSRSDEALDRNCEESLFRLIAELEQIKARLQGTRVRRRPVRGLGLLEEVLNRVAEFAESVPGAPAERFSMRDRLSAAAASYPPARFIRVEENRVSLATAADRFTRWKDAPADRVRYFRQLCSAALLAVEEQFVRFAAGLHSATRRDLWRETYSVFLLDLGHQLESLPL